MYLYLGDIDVELLHNRSIDNRALDVAAELEEVVARLVVCVVRAGYLGALEVEHALVCLVLRPMSLAWVQELGSQ